MLEPGRILSGKYRLEAEIGRGGMGSVWRSTRLDLGTSVAVKVMHGQPSDNPLAFDRFAREAKAAASLNSPHVVRIIDFGLDAATHTPFIAMELLDGESLAQRLEREGRLAPAAVSRVITHVARALAEAHTAGIIHRDLKPANIFLVRNADDELVKLLDFGVAKAAGNAATATGHVMGTPYYMSPEQVNSLKSIDQRADLWSLAVIASECLTGRKPFMADTLSELAMKISLGRAEVPSTVGSVPAGFDAWFARGTSVDPAGRFQSASELARELQTLLKDERIEAVAPSGAGLAFTATQKLDSMAHELPDAAPHAEARTHAAALSTTARGGVSRNSAAAGARRWPVPFGVAALLTLALGLGLFLRKGQDRAPAVVETRAALGTDTPAATASASGEGAPPRAASEATAGVAPRAQPASETTAAAVHEAPAGAASATAVTPRGEAPAAADPAASGSASAALPAAAVDHPSAQPAPARASSRPSKPSKAAKASKATRTSRPLDRLDAYDMP